MKTPILLYKLLKPSELRETAGKNIPLEKYIHQLTVHELEMLTDVLQPDKPYVEEGYIYGTRAIDTLKILLQRDLLY